MFAISKKTQGYFFCLDEKEGGWNPAGGVYDLLNKTRARILSKICDYNMNKSARKFLDQTLYLTMYQVDLEQMSFL